MIDETTKFNRAEGYYKRDASMGNVDGSWKNFVANAKVQRSEMDNFNTPDLDQGSDSILRPGETLEDDFDVTFRRPNAEGGFQQLVQPNNDGSRPGYKGDKSTDKVLLERLQAYNDKALQRSSQALYDKYGQDVVDAASIEKFGVPYNEFKPKNDPKGNKRSNFRLKFMSDMKKYGRYISPAESASVGANKRSLDEAKIKLNIIEATKEGNPLNVEQFTKDNDITVKELKKQTKTLQKNIYIKRSLVSGKDSPNKLLWLTDDLTTTDNVLKTLTKQKLIINDADSIDNIMFNAFGREFEEGTTDIKNPNYNIEKYSAIQKNLSEYRALNKYIDKTYGIKTELDHPLSKKIIRQLMNGTAEDLSRVNILEKNLNQQFKNQLNINYSKAVDSGNIKQKRAVEKIAKKFKLNIGSVPDDQFFDVSKIDRGAPSFETLDIKKEMLKSLDNAASLDTEFLKYIKKNPGVFEDAEININKIVKPKNVENISKNIKNIRADLENLMGKIEDIDPKLAKKVNIQLNSGIPINQMLEEIRKIPGIDKLGRGFMKAGGPFELAFIGLDAVNELSKGKTGEQSLKTALSNFTFGAYEGNKIEDINVLLNTAKNLNIDSTGFNELLELQYLEKKLLTEKGNLQKTFQYGMDERSVEKYKNLVDKLQNEFDTKSTALQEKVDINSLVKNYTNTTKSLSEQQFDKSKKRLLDSPDPTSGVVGNAIYDIVDYKTYLPQNFLQNSITKVIPNTLRKLPFVGSIFEPTSDRAKLFDSSKEEKEIRLGEKKNSVLQELQTPYYPKAEGGIIGLRSKYEYKK